MTAFDVLERQLHDATATRRRRRGPRPLGALVLVAAAVIAALVVLDTAPPPRSDERSVTAPPVAYLSPDPDKIVYVRATSVDQDGSPMTVEDWHRGQETRRLLRWTDKDGKQWANEHVISRAGVMEQVNEEGEYRVIRRTDMEDARNVIDAEQAGFLADFQQRFAAGTLDPVPREFAGRPAYRYHVPNDPAQVGPRGPDQSFYVDRVTGAPLGFTSELEMNPSQVLRTTQTVDKIEFLDPTSENLARLRKLTLEIRSR